VNDIPRRIDISRFSPAEKAIREAMHAIEAMPPDVRLTDAIVLLERAKAKVADFVDGVKP
jgi:stage III sporulation protein SpoIIIAA